MKIFFLFISIISSQILMGKELLIIFADKNAPQAFQQQSRQEIIELAATEELELIWADPQKGVPAEITTLPAIVFQSDKGRYYYAGRYTEISTIKNFIRSSRVALPINKAFSKNDCYVKQWGRAKVGMALKLTPLQAKKDSPYTKQEFQEEFSSRLTQQLIGYQYQEKASFQKTDRLFYLDVHPYLDDAQQLYLSVAIYSPFNCIEPIYSNFNSPIKGHLDRIDNLIELVSKEASQQITTCLQSSTIGDAYLPIDNLAQVSWESLGLKLEKPTNLKGLDSQQQTQNLADTWKYDRAIDKKVPVLFFRFQPPLDRYAGEFKQIQGKMDLDANKQIQQIQFEVEVGSMTMGMESLDTKVLKSYLKAKKFPKATFSSTLIGKHEPLVWGQTSTLSMEGDLQLLKKESSVQVQAYLTPSFDAAGQPIIIVQAKFGTNITQNYMIKGPDGPAEASENMEFDMNFIMTASK